MGIIFIAAGLVMIGYAIYKVIYYFVRIKNGPAATGEAMKKEYDKLLSSLSTGAKRIETDGYTIEIRDCYDREEGKLDPRTEETGKMTREYFKKNLKSLHPDLIPNEIHLFGPLHKERYSELEYLRTQFGWVSKDRSSAVKTNQIAMRSSGVDFSVYKYEVPSKDKNRPCMVFFHGGGFFGGIIPTTENQCKLLAELSGGVVISVDYPLAPEYKFPAGFNACYETVEWVRDNAGTLGISPGRIAVCGDSAGGNLALCCALRARDEGKDMIAYMGLIYPTVTRALDSKDEYYYFDISAYANPDEDSYIDEQIHAIGKDAAGLNIIYVPEDEDPMQPYISPITASMNDLPKTLVMTAEYDFLRLECEALTGKMARAGVNVRHIRYGGIVHGTFDRLGYAPQVEDMLREMAKDMRRLK